MPAGQDAAPKDTRAGHRTLLLRRATGALLDLRIIVGWILLTTALGQVMSALDRAPQSPEAWDAYAFLTLVLPTALSFAVAESSPNQATWGKRRRGLKVVDRDGRRISLGRSLLRQLAKFGPWQMAHTAVFQLFAGHTSGLIWFLALGAQALVLASGALVLLTRPSRALHDVIAGTRVIDSLAADGKMRAL